MVDFTLTDEQKSLRELAHDFAEKEIRPVAWEYDKDGTWPQDVFEKAHEVGLMNTHVPEEYGGAGLVLPRRLPHRGGALLGLLGHPDLARRQRPGRRAGRCSAAPRRSRRSSSALLVESPKFASFCLTEPGAGSDVSCMRTKRRQARATSTS